MPEQPVNERVPFAQETAVAGATDFSYNWWIREKDDIQVFVDGVETSDYTIADSGVQNADGGIVVMNDPMVGGEVVTVRSDFDIERLTGFTTSGSLRAKALNLELSTIIAILLQLNRDIQRSFKMSSTSSMTPANFVSPEAISGRALVFDGVGGAIRASTQDIDTLATTLTTSVNSATAAQAAAEAARDQTLSAFDNFDDRYLGSKASAPTVDNDGDALVAGQLYFDTSDNEMKVYTGSAWVAAYVTGSDFLAISSNLSDLGDAAAARSNLGVSVGSDVQAYDATLQALAALGVSANQMIYSTGADAFATTALTSAARSLLDDSSVSAMRTTLGLGNAATLTAGTAANNLVQLDGTGKLPAVDGSQLTGIASLPEVVFVGEVTPDSTGVSQWDVDIDLDDYHEILVLMYKIQPTVNNSGSRYPVVQFSENGGSSWSGALKIGYSSVYSQAHFSHVWIRPSRTNGNHGYTSFYHDNSQTSYPYNTGGHIEGSGLNFGTGPGSLNKLRFKTSDGGIKGASESNYETPFIRVYKRKFPSS